MGCKELDVTERLRTAKRKEEKTGKQTVGGHNSFSFHS